MMKTAKFLLVSLMLFAFTANVKAGNQQKKEAEVTYSVNMHCANCKKKVDNTVAHEKGVVDMKSSLEKTEVWVKYNTEKTDKEKIKKAIEKLGYTVVELAQADVKAKK